MAVRGLNNIKKLFKNKGVEVTRQSIRILDLVSIEGRNVAVRKAPAAFGKLRQGINFERRGTRSKLFSQMPYSVYVEFGTGKKVKIPVDLPNSMKNFAAKYRGKRQGNFDDFLQGLSRWARLKGIPKEAVYPIAMTLIEEGQEPQPFMRPAFIAARKKLLIELKKL